MKFRAIIFVLSAFLLFCACSKNTVSKIPYISLVLFYPLDSTIVNADTVFIAFNLTDGDADIGNDSTSGIFLKDSRYDTGYVEYQFPAITPGSIETPKYGLQGTCNLFPAPPTPRPDSLHTATGDTLTYELYITDRAGHKSNHIVTHPLIIRP